MIIPISILAVSQCSTVFFHLCGHPGRGCAGWGRQHEGGRSWKGSNFYSVSQSETPCRFLVCFIHVTQDGCQPILQLKKLRPGGERDASEFPACSGTLIPITQFQDGRDGIDTLTMKSSQILPHPEDGTPRPAFLPWFIAPLFCSEPSEDTTLGGWAFAFLQQSHFWARLFGRRG